MSASKPVQKMTVDQLQKEAGWHSDQRFLERTGRATISAEQAARSLAVSMELRERTVSVTAAHSIPAGH